MELINRCKMLIEVMDGDHPKYSLNVNGNNVVEMCGMMHILPAAIIELAPKETLVIHTHVPSNRVKMRCLKGLLVGDMPIVRITVEALDLSSPEEDAVKVLEETLTTAVTTYEKSSGKMVRKVIVMRFGVNVPIDVIQMNTL